MTYDDRIIEYVEEHPGCAAREIAVGLGVAPDPLCWSLAELSSRGLLCREKAQRHICNTGRWFLAEVWCYFVNRAAAERSRQCA